ncbi:hypothetical protein [Thioalkalivibrio sp.]|uniref:hypothetical protein n=1 Tax=Thioalkalivibrio sp. TaxID=2093813 RepID=UPI003975162F
MKAVPSSSGPDPDLDGPSVSEAPEGAPDAAQGRVWLLDPSRIGHLPACLRALGVSMAHEGRED